MNTVEPLLLPPSGSDVEIVTPDLSLLPEPCRTCSHTAGLMGDLSTSPKQNAAYWKYQALHNRDLLEKANDRIHDQEAEIRRLRQALYGKKAEGGKGPQGPETGSPPPSRPRGHQKGVPSVGRKRHDHLPSVSETIDLPADETVCSSCHKPYAPFGPPETSEILEIEVRPHRRVIHRTRYRKTCSCPEGKGIVTAPPPPRLIPKGMLGVSIWVEILFFKFFLHLPLSRLLADWNRRGLDLSLGTVTSGLERIASFLEPFHEAIVRKSREASFSQADETRYYVFGSKTAPSRWWLWVILTPETSLFILDPSRSSKVPLEHFAGRPGVLMVDRYSAYKATARQIPGLVLAFCWAHVRRDFLQAVVKKPALASWADSWTSRIGTLFHETARMRQGSLSARTAVLSLLSDMKTTAREEVIRMERSRETVARKVLQSLLIHWDGLVLFVDDPRIPMDNNASERALRGAVTGRKVFYGVGAPWSGTRTATLYSLFVPWDRAGLNVRRLLSDCLSECARRGQAPSDLSPWLPWSLSSERRALIRNSLQDSG